MAKINDKLKSIRVKLFLTLCVIIVLAVLLLVLINSVVLEKFYIYSKARTVKQVYDEINQYYSDNSTSSENIDKELQDKIKIIALNNNLEILLKTKDNIKIVAANSNDIENIYNVNISK